MKYSFFVFFFIIYHLKLFAQDSLTIEQAIATALQNNYDIQVSRNDSLVAAINYAYRNIAFLPQTNATTTILFNNNAQKQTLANGTVKSGSGIKSNNSNAAVGLNWVVFNGLRMFATRNKLGEYVQLGSLSIKSQINNTVSDVIKTYYDIVRQKQQLRNIQEQISLNADQLKLAQYKFEIGTGIKPDVLQAQIDLNQQKAAQFNQLATIDKRKQDLASLMNVSPAINYEVSDSIPVQTDLVLGDLLNNLSLTNPQLQIARQNIDIARLTIKENRGDLFPVISLTTAYNFSKTNNNTVINPYVPLTNLNQGLNYGITASIPLFNQFRVRQTIKQAQLAADYQQLLYSRQQLTLNDSVMNVYRTYDAQKKIVTLSDSTILLARENLNIARERYRLGVTTFIELRQAEQNVEQTLTTLITARYNLKVAETELLRLKGALIRRQ